MQRWISRHSAAVCTAAAVALGGLWQRPAATQDAPAPGAVSASAEGAAKTPAGLVRLSPKGDVWLDKANQRVVMGGRIVQTEGPMELFACLRNTKEHESIVAVNTEAYVVHAALLALGAEPGSPVQFRPQYAPATGTEIDVMVYWTDALGKRRQANARDMLRNVRTNKPLDQPWVFGGSGFWVDPRTGRRHYLAEEGDFICVSNFASAMLDLPIESTQANAALLFEGIKQKIPERYSRVSVVLLPRLEGAKPDRGGDPEIEKYMLPVEEEEEREKAKREQQQNPNDAGGDQKIPN